MLTNILHLIDTTGPGGAETIFIDLATRFNPDKFRAIVVIRGKGWVYEELVRKGCLPIVFNSKGSFNWRYLVFLYRLIKKERINIIQSHLLGSNVYASLVGLIARVKVVATFHGSVDISDKERLKRLKFSAINIGANTVVAVSQGLRDDIIGKSSIRPSCIKVIYNGIDNSRFCCIHTKKLWKSFGWAIDDFIVGSLGNIRTAKGYEVLLQAASLLTRNDKTRKYRFVIAGQGDINSKLYRNLLKMRKDLALENVVFFLGYVEETPEFLSNLDIFLSSSLSEGLPLSAIQAMASELPILATRCGGYEELIEQGKNGLLVEIGQPSAIALEIQRMAENPNMRKLLASQARKQVIEMFDINVMLKQYEALYEELVV